MALYVEAAKFCSVDSVGTAAGSDLHFKQTISPAANSKKTSPEVEGIELGSWWQDHQAFWRHKSMRPG